MYPYHLGCHLKSGRLCRIPHPDLGVGIPQGCARLLKFRNKGEKFIRRPYDANGELDNRYWAIPRWTDIQRELGEERTGPNMFQLFMNVDYSEYNEQRIANYYGGFPQDATSTKI